MLRQALRPVMLWRGQEGSFTVVSLRPLEPAGGGDEDETATPRGAVISSPGKMHLS